MKPNSSVNKFDSSSAYYQLVQALGNAILRLPATPAMSCPPLFSAMFDAVLSSGSPVSLRLHHEGMMLLPLLLKSYGLASEFRSLLLLFLTASLAGKSWAKR